MAINAQGGASIAESRVLLLPPTRRDADVMQRLLRAAELTCEVYPSAPALCQAIEEGAGMVIVSEESLYSDGAALATCLNRQPVWSDLPVVVLSRGGVETPALAATLAQLGNASVLERPVRVSTLVSVVRTALRARERQYQVRAHLAELARAGEALRQGEERFRLVIENIKDYAIFMVTPEGCIASWNPGAEEILGFSSVEALHKDAAMLFTPEDRAAGIPERELTTARREGRASDVRWHVRQDKTRIFVDGVLTAVRDEQGVLLGFSKLMRDVTQRKRHETERERLFEAEREARSEAERAGRMKDEFLATLSHELRTPLNAILGWAEILTMHEVSAEDRAEGVNVIRRNARAQAQIIEDLLDMSRIISGKVRLNVERMDLGDVIRAAMETVKPAANAKEIRIQAVLDSKAAPLSGDPNRLQQVFWNLLSNAVKFTPKGGEVRIVLERVESHVEVSIIDSGDGIDGEFLPHVFDRFRQADATTTRKHGGLGLGLAIVKQLVELHGGSVKAESLGVGQGSKFSVCLPLAPVHPSAAPSPKEHSPCGESSPFNVERRAHLAGLKVLVVDDEPDARGLLQRLLNDCQVTVATAGSADEALGLLAVERPDVLVSDIGMPGRDGYALIRAVRTLPAEQGGHTPALALTAYARAEDRVHALMAGFQHHLAKPVEPAEFLAVIATLAQRNS